MSTSAETDIANIWSDDLLERKTDADFIITFLQGRIAERRAAGGPGSFVLNIDSRWGEGKTFFLTRLKQHAERNGHLAIYINAWLDDHADDAMVAVVSAIDSALKPILGSNQRLSAAWAKTKRVGLRIAAATAKGLLKTAAKKIIGEGVDEIANIVSASGKGSKAATSSDVTDNLTLSINSVIDEYADNAVEQFRVTSESIAEFKRRLKETVSQLVDRRQSTPPMMVFVDELDRCRPSYAVQLLERIKHLFEIDGVVFIVAADTEQLQHSISAVYGAGFDSRRYLNRFFDRRYSFSEVSRKVFVSRLISTIDSAKLHAPEADKLNYAATVLAAADLSLRDVEQASDLLRTISTVWAAKRPIELTVILPLIVLFQSGNIKGFDDLASGSFDRESIFRSGVSGPMVEFGRQHNLKEERILFVDLVAKFAKKMKVPLPEVMKTEPGLMSDRYVFGVFVEEFGREHQNTTVGDASRLMSLMRRYGSLVRSAGRLSRG